MRKFIAWLKCLIYKHDWKCSNRAEDMFDVDETNVRFKCTRCNKEEGL